MKITFLLYRAFQAYEIKTKIPNPLRILRQDDDMHSALELLDQVKSPERAFPVDIQVDVAKFLSAFFYDTEELSSVGTVFEKSYRDGLDSRVQEEIKTGRIIPSKRVDLFEYSH